MTELSRLLDREIDVLIAEKIMLWDIKWYPAWQNPEDGCWFYLQNHHPEDEDAPKKPFRVIDGDVVVDIEIPHFSRSRDACFRAEEQFHNSNIGGYEKYIQKRRVLARKEYRVIRGRTTSNGEHGVEFEWIDRQSPKIRCFALLMTLEELA